MHRNDNRAKHDRGAHAEGDQRKKSEHSRHVEASGLDRKHWSNAGPVRKIFKEAFATAGLSYFNPHSFRKTLALLGRAEVQVAGRVQGVVPKPRPRACAHDVFELRGTLLATGKRRSFDLGKAA